MDLDAAICDSHATRAHLAVNLSEKNYDGSKYADEASPYIQPRLECTTSESSSSTESCMRRGAVASGGRARDRSGEGAIGN